MIEKLNRPMGSPLSGIATLRDARSKRFSSWDRTGGNQDYKKIKKGETLVLAEMEGAGCIHHIWITVNALDPWYLRKMVLRMYWDGETEPSVETPLGDFFGVGHGVANPYWSLPLNMMKSPGVGKNAAMNCFFPMPFAKGARVEVANQCDSEIPNFYYYVDYEEYEELAGDVGRFHAVYNMERPTHAVKTKLYHASPWNQETNLDGKDNYVILDAKGQGQYVGCALSVDNIGAYTQRHQWWGEGDDMIFIDGEPFPPSLHGTGTEDYFCEAWGFPSGETSTPYHGISLGKDTTDWTGKWSVYRFHIEDPIRFRKSIRVTIEHGHANNQGNDYSSVAYWYQLEPHKKLKGLPLPEKRIPRPTL